MTGVQTCALPIWFEEVGQLVEAYPKFEILDEKYVAEDSLIREFIGGGIYDD